MNHLLSLLVAAILVTGPAPAGVEVVRLAWDPSPDLWIVGYHVYRRDAGPGAGGEPVRLNAEPVDEPFYLDETVEPGAEYCYRVTALSLEGGESPPSAELCVDVFRLRVGPGGSYASGDLVVLAASSSPVEGVAFHWSQLSGPPVEALDWGAPELVFYAPSVDSPALLLFEVSARLDARERTAQITVALEP